MGTIYKCEECKKERSLGKATIFIINGSVEVKQAKCECGIYMKAKPKKGMPSLIRTEPTLKKK